MSESNSTMTPIVTPEVVTETLRTAYARGDLAAMRRMVSGLTDQEFVDIGEGKATLAQDGDGVRVVYQERDAEAEAIADILSPAQRSALRLGIVGAQNRTLVALERRGLIQDSEVRKGYLEKSPLGERVAKVLREMARL